MEALLPLIIQAVSGAVGGGLAGQFIKQAAMRWADWPAAAR